MAENTTLDPDELIRLEMDYTTYCDSCRSPLVTEWGSVRECRRTRGHEPPHASGFRNAELVRWVDPPAEGSKR